MTLVASEVMTPRRLSHDTAVRRLVEARDRFDAAVLARRRLVARARRDGVRWRVIADALGVLESKAIRKYRRFVDVPDSGVDRLAGRSVTPAQLRRAVAAVHAADDGIYRAVAGCRGSRPQTTWGEIADVLRMHQPNAVIKFGPLLDPAPDGSVTLLPRESYHHPYRP